MWRPTRLSRHYFLCMIVLVFVATFLLVAISSYYSIRLFRQDSQRAADTLMTYKRELIRVEVVKVLEEIDFARKCADADLRKMLTQRVTEACSMAEGLFQAREAALSRDEIEQRICAALRPVRFNNGRGCYFIARMDGRSMLAGPFPELERKQLNDADPQAAAAVTGMINVVRDQGAGFFEYARACPSGPGHPRRKVVYVKYFAPLDCFIGTGEYLDDWVADLQQALLERVRTISYRKDGYVFVGDWDGMMLAGRVREGVNVLDYEDPYGFKITRALIRASKRGEGFLTYYFKKPDGDEVVEKLTFVKGIPEWRWYVGTGIYLDDVKTYLVAQHNRLRYFFLREAVRGALLLLVIGYLGYLVARFLNRRMKDELAVFNEFFAHSALKNEKIDVSRLRYKEFTALARYANAMVDEVAASREAGEKLEQQMQQAQRLESLGILAGGIAHDFNNMLMAIGGFTELALLETSGKGEQQEHLRQIQIATSRASELVKQILAFSRNDVRARKVVALNSIIEDAARMMRATIPTTIAIQTDFASEPIQVLVDATQMHQVVMNLCTNAVFAVQGRDNGEIVISLQVVQVEAVGDLSVVGDLAAGCYARLGVRDNGSGIPPEVLPRIFDPFFTTKPKGKGTGLGLSVVHGILRSHGGGIRVLSKPGQGALFECFLPVCSLAPESTDSPAAEPVAQGKGECIILVDDEPAIAVILRRRLVELGYHVESFTSSLEALNRVRHSPADVDLVITDQTMPQLSGFDMGQEMLRIRPGLPIVVCTGYSDTLTEARAREKGFAAFLFKPFKFDVLARTISALLQKTGSGA
ncbi:MAG: cache domain-containing protein [bacterium]